MNEILLYSHISHILCSHTISNNVCSHTILNNGHYILLSLFLVGFSLGIFLVDLQFHNLHRNYEIII